MRAKAPMPILAAGTISMNLTKSAPAMSEQRHPLIGNCKLLSWQVIADDGTPQDVFGASPPLQDRVRQALH